MSYMCVEMNMVEEGFTYETQQSVNVRRRAEMAIKQRQHRVQRSMTCILPV